MRVALFCVQRIINNNFASHRKYCEVFIKTHCLNRIGKSVYVVAFVQGFEHKACPVYFKTVVAKHFFPELIRVARG